MPITVKQKGDFSRTYRWLERIKHEKFGSSILDKFGRLGVMRLNELTPKETGKTASSWYYDVRYERDGAVLTFSNSNVVGGEVIALLIQEGHGTGTGGFVPARPYLDEAMEPIYKDLFGDIWKEVTSE